MHRSAPLAAAAVVVALLSGCDDAPVTLTTLPHVHTPTVDYARWAAGRSHPVADPADPRHGDPALDVLHYNLSLSWDAATGTFTGLATVDIRPATDGDRIRLDFAPFPLDRVAVGDRVAADATVTDGKLVVPAVLRKDQPLSLTVAYHGRPAGNPLGLTVTPQGTLQTIQEPYGAGTWYPANELPSDEALYDVSVTAPDGWSAIAAGSPNGRNLDTFYYRSPTPMATYQQTLAIGPYREISMLGPRGLPLSFWYRPGVDDHLLPAIRRSPAYLAFLSQRFGKYPFRTGGLVVIDSTASAPTQQMLTIGGRQTPFNDATFTNTLVHQWAAQWFGGPVSPATWSGRWLAEGWATYAQYLYEQSVHHFSDQALDGFLRRADADARRQFGPPGRPRVGTFAATNMSVSPAAMLHQIRRRLGDQRFFALARAWAGQRGTASTRASFTAFVNRTTGENLTPLINSWLDSPATPR